MPPFYSDLSTSYDHLLSLLSQDISVSGENPASPVNVSAHIQELESVLAYTTSLHQQWIHHLESLQLDDPYLNDAKGNYESFFMEHKTISALTLDVLKKTAMLRAVLQQASQTPNPWNSVPPLGPISTGPTSQGPIAIGIKLPKLATPSFNGNPLKWTEFWDIFAATVHNNSSLSDVQKLAYLKGMMSGTALSAISSLKTTNSNYSAAIDILQERFGRSDAIQQALFNKLRSIRVSTNKVHDLQSTQDAIVQVITQLESLSVDTNQALIIQLIFDKFPVEFVTELVKEKKTTGAWTIQQLQGAVTHLINQKEEIQLLTGRPTGNPTNYKEQHSKQQPPPQQQPQPYRSYPKQAKPPIKTMGSYENNCNSSKYGSYKISEPITQRPLSSCIYCNKTGHYYDKCTDVRGCQDRTRILDTLRVCHLCLKPNHKQPNCPKRSTSKCHYCNKIGAHHRSLCPNMSQKPMSNPPSKSGSNIASLSTNSNGSNNNNPPSTVMPQPTPSHNITFSSSNINAHVKNSNAILLTASAVVFNMQTGKRSLASLFFDTGAQRTFIKDSFASLLGQDSQGKESLDLQTFASVTDKRVQSDLVHFSLQLKNGSFLPCQANTVPYLTGPLTQQALCPSDIEYMSAMSPGDLAEPILLENRLLEPDILIGNDYVWRLLSTTKIILPSGLFLLESKLGYILGGTQIAAPDMTILHQEPQIDHEVSTVTNQVIDQALHYDEVETTIPSYNLVVGTEDNFIH